MREIKFRAWHKKERIMFFVDNIFKSYGGVCWVNETKKLPINKLYGYDGEDIELMQFIGLKDKNGVEIYEGDIVKAINMSHNKEVLKEWTGEVKYGHNNCCYGLNRKLNISNDLSVAVMQNFNYPLHNFMNFGCGIVPDIDLEVIGNIYENPELLEED